MKKLLTVTACLFMFSFIHLNAQTQTRPAKHSGNKGHFVLGTNLFNYYTGSLENKEYSNNKLVDTMKESYSNLLYSLNVWVGYFVSDKVCLGLNFVSLGSQGIAPYYYYNYYYYTYSSPVSVAPLSLAFRYYAVTADSGHGADLFFEGIAGGTYSVDRYSNKSNSTNVIPPVYFTSADVNINVAGAYNFSPHFSIQAKAGLLYVYNQFHTPAYSSTSNGFTQNYDSEKQTINAITLQGAVALQYKL